MSIGRPLDDWRQRAVMFRALGCQVRCHAWRVTAG
jgi:hypothetical protein